ncbi:MAG: alpha/beta hydrolase [Pyrinomonadaceae bacterium]
MNKKLLLSILAVLITASVLFVGAAFGFVYLAPDTATRFLIGVDRWRSGLVRKEIKLSDGTQYVYLEGGQGEPLILLHGFGGNKDNFARVSRFLTGQYRVIIPDHIGFGESAHPRDADYSPTAQAERLNAFAFGLNLKNPHLGGNSMGGQIALSYVALYPTEVKSLWLLDTAGIWSAPESEIRKTILETGENPLLVRNVDEFLNLFDRVMSEPPFVPGPILNVMAQERIRNYELEERIFGQIAADSIEERVRGLATPTLIVWGDEDRLINVATADVLHKLMPNSQVIIMKGIGHVPMLERPQQSAEDYLRFRAAMTDFR